MALLLATGCGGSKPSPLPQQATYASVMGAGTCRSDSTGEPLLVDWRPEQRADLEVAMRSGVAVVKYDCQSLELLPDCSVEGSYGFMGVTTKEQVVRFEDADEVRANLPFSGMKLGAELSRGTTLDVALVMIGKKMSTRREARRQELHGRCAGASHFVRGVTVGAFAMASGASGQAALASEMFGVGASASTRSAKQVMNKEGRLDSCEAANPESPIPPSQCGAPLRMQLLPIDGALAVANDIPACPPGFVLSGEKCTKPSENVAYLCQGDDVAGCTKQCERRDARSCTRLADMYFHGKVVPMDRRQAASIYDRACELGDLLACNTRAAFHYGDRDYGRALGLYKQACDGGEESACANLGTMYKEGRGVPKDEARAATLYRLACDGGNPPACGMLGDMVADGRGVAKDPARALELFERACQGSFPRGCANLGRRYMEGTGVPKDPAKAFELLTRACDGDDGRGCMFLGHLYAKGIGTRQDELRAFSLYQRACDGNYLQACMFVGSMYELGQGIAKNVNAALPYYMLACEDGNDPACGMLGGKYVVGEDIPRDLDKAARAFSFGCARLEPTSCGHLGDVATMFFLGEGVPKDPVKAASLYQIACGSGEIRSCGNLAYMNEHGIGIRRDLAQAIKGYERACQAGNQNACSNLAVMMSTNGKGMSVDPLRAVNMFRAACNEDEAWGCLNLATYAAYGIVHAKDASFAEATVKKVCGGTMQEACVSSMRRDCTQGEARACTVLGALSAGGTGFPKNAKAGLDLVRDGCAKGDDLGCMIANRLGAPPTGKLPAPPAVGQAFPIPDGPLPPPARTPPKAPTALGQSSNAMGPSPLSSRSSPSSPPTSARDESQYARAPNAEPPARKEPVSYSPPWEPSTGVRMELGAARWKAEGDSLDESWGGLLVIRSFSVEGERFGFMSAYDLAIGYTNTGHIPHDMSFLMGLGLRLGPLMLAPGLGLGFDGVNGGSDEAFRVPTAFYWKLEGRVLLNAGPITIEGQAARIRRGNVVGAANEEIPSETRFLGRIYTPLLEAHRFSIGLEFTDYQAGQGLTGLFGVNL